jgi:class 3 adenylate cyclase
LLRRAGDRSLVCLVYLGCRGARLGGAGMAELPSGTVTFLFTDLEGSTRLWEEHPEAMRAALAEHDELIREAVVGNRGHVVKTTGDGAHAGVRHRR